MRGKKSLAMAGRASTGMPRATRQSLQLSAANSASSSSTLSSTPAPATSQPAPVPAVVSTVTPTPGTGATTGGVSPVVTPQPVQPVQPVLQKTKEQEPELTVSSTTTTTTEGAQGAVPEELEWTDAVEVLFFKALIKHKPLGINKHFNMLLASHEFKTALGRDVNVKELWQHLEEMYCLEELELLERAKFPMEESEFCLSDEQFGDMMTKVSASEKVTKNAQSPPPSPPPQKKPAIQKKDKSGIVRRGRPPLHST